MIRTLLALFRIRQLMRIERIAGEVAAEIDAHDWEINGTPPHYHDARPPTALDYNFLFGFAERLPRKVNGKWQFREDLETKG